MQRTRFQKYPLTNLIALMLMVFTIANTLQTAEQLNKASPNALENNRIRILQFVDMQSSIDTEMKQKIFETTNEQTPSIQFGTFSNLAKVEQVPSVDTLNKTLNSSVPAQKQPIIPLTQVNTAVVGKGFKVDNGVSYQRLHVGDLLNKYLFLDFKLSEKDQMQQVNFTVSFEGSTEPLLFCTYNGYDSCYLAKQVLKKDINLFIFIKCQGDCTYSFKSWWSDIEHLIPGQEIIFLFGEEKTQIFHVELDDEDFEEVRIHLAPRATKRYFDNVKIYGTYGSQKSPTETSYDFKSMSLWEDGQGLFLLKKNMKSQSFTLLIVGQGETTYQLTCKLVKEKIHQIGNNQHIYEYLESKSTKKYHLKLSDIELFEEYSFKFSILSGLAEIQYYTDAEMTKEYPISTLDYMKDSEYIIARQQVGDLAKSGIYIKVSTAQRDATYTLKFVGMSSTSPFQIHEHVYSFIPVSPNKPKFAYFNFKDWISETQQRKNLKFTVSKIQVLGKSKIQFRVCKTTFDQCINPAFFDNFTSELTIQSQDVISQKEVFQFTIKNQALSKINDIQQQANIIMRITSLDKEKSANSSSLNIMALEFINNNKVLYLRESRPFQQKLLANETKSFKYINSDENVQQIRVHMNLISGNVRMSGVIKAADSSQSITVSPEANTLKFGKNLTLPIIVTIHADTKSLVIITMQIIHKSDLIKQSNVITIGQDLTYTTKILPQTYTVFEVVPIFYNFRFYYSATHSVIVCLLDVNTSKCVNNNNTNTSFPSLSLKSEIKDVDVSNTGKKARIQILNPFSDHSTQVTVIFHSRAIDRCQEKKLGKLYNGVAKDKNCIYYLLDDGNSNGLQIYASKREFFNLAYTLFLCGNSIQGVNSQKFLKINSNIIKQKCGKTLEGWKLVIYWDIKSNSSESQVVKTDFLAQYQGGVTIVPEGVGYRAVELSKSSLLRKFGFKLINKITTRIVISPIIGQLIAYARIIEQVDKNIQNISNINYQFSSTRDADYRQQPIIVITQKDIQSASCSDCFILIAVYTSQTEGILVEFELEVIQKIQTLHDGLATVGYLQAESVAYYQYDINEKKNTSILFVLSDHNEYCVKLSLGTYEYPNSSNSIASTGNNTIVPYLHLGGEKRYFLTVYSSSKSCEYSVTVVTADTLIQHLSRGKQTLVQLIKGSKNYFVFQNFKEPFKIFAISRFGEIKFYLNKSSIEINKRSLRPDDLNTDKFQYSSEQSNILAVDQTNPIFCEYCNYFIAVEAIKNTISTLLLASPLTIVPLVTRKFFSDYLEKKGNFTLLSYKRIQKTHLQVTIHSGEIEIVAIYKQAKMSQTFSAKSQHQKMVIDVNKQLMNSKNNTEGDINSGSKINGSIRYPQRLPINLIVTAKSDKTSYTLRPTSLESKNLDDVASYQDILAGEPNHIDISSQKIGCLEGYYRESNEDVIITVSSDNHQKLSNVVVNGKINKIQAKIQKTIVKNLLILNLTTNQNRYEGASYQICLKYDNSKDDWKDEKNLKSLNPSDNQTQNPDEVIIKAVVTQANTINLLLSDTETIIKGQSIFTVYHQGDFLLDVFECEAEKQALISYQNTIQKLKNSTGKKIHEIGALEQSHAIRVVQNDSANYVRVNSKLSVLRWLPINEQNDEGTGYMKFTIGDLRYDSKFKYVQIQYQPLQNIKASKSSIIDIEYTLLISNDSKQLYKLTQCDSANQTKVMLIPLQKLNHPIKGLQTTYTIYDIKKDLLQATFSSGQNIYLTIVAKLTLQLTVDARKEQKYRNPSSDEHQHYRFIYNRQEIPPEAFKQSQIESIPYHFLFLIIISSAGLVLLITYVLTRQILPLIARIKTRNLVEEKDAQPQADLAEVPPSSDRNQRANNIVVETEDALKK